MKGAVIFDHFLMLSAYTNISKHSYFKTILGYQIIT